MDPVGVEHEVCASEDGRITAPEIGAGRFRTPAARAAATTRRMTSASRKRATPQARSQTPADDPTFTRDLNPESPDGRIPAERIKRLHTRLDELTDAELERLSVLEAGARLRQGSVYLDLRALEAGPFVAGGAQAAEPGRHLISKAETDHELWNRLTGRPDFNFQKLRAARGHADYDTIRRYVKLATVRPLGPATCI